jgi:HEAT repeat protein
VLASDTAPRAVRRGAVRGLGRLAGPRAAAALAPVLDRDRDPLVRAAAAEALAAEAPADACERIRARAQVETAPSRFRRALATCDRAARAEPPRR